MAYKLTYFNVRGKGETIRMLLCLAGQKFEDNRINDMDEWNKIKNDMPFGQIPILEYEGKVLCQSKAIERFIARKYGLCGNNEHEDAHCNMVVECVEDTVSPLYGYYWTEDEQVQKVMKETYIKNLPQNLKNLEKMLNEHNVFLGQSISWPDISLYNTLAWAPSTAMGLDISSILAQFPKIQRNNRMVESDPKIKEWIAKRPQTEI